jgi:hypothetical protein
MINDDAVNRSKMAGLVNEVKSYYRSGRVCKVTHISREINCVSHNLAQLSRALSCFKIWIRSGPDEIRLALIFPPQGGNFPQKKKALGLLFGKTEK